MTQFTKTVIINSSNREVWETLANLGNIYKFNPGVKKSYYTSASKEGVGAARICELYPAGKIQETIRKWVPGKEFLLEIQTIEKAPPVKFFSGQFVLNNFSEDKIEVSVTIRYDMKLGVLGSLLNKLVIQSKKEEGIEDLLKGLKLHLEEEVEVINTKVLNNLLGSSLIDQPAIYSVTIMVRVLIQVRV